MTRFNTSLVIFALSLSACSDADTDADLTAAEAQLMDAAASGDIVRLAYDFGRNADRDNVSTIENVCGGLEMVFDKARPDPRIQLDGRIEISHWICDPPEHADSSRESLLDLDLVVTLGEAQVAIEGELLCTALDSGAAECRPMDSGVFVELETDRATVAEIGQDNAWELFLAVGYSDPHALLLSAAGCWTVYGTNGEPIDVCPVAI